jgi:cellulose 1,4-beta-cellobiosidase
MGTCCPEMDIWEANSISTAYTPHPCDDPRPTVCNGDSCGGTYSAERYGGTCDPDGCDFNSFRQGNKTFYGPGATNTVNTQQKMTVVTQFITHDGTDTGRLTEIKRFYVQGGRTIANSESTIPGVPGNSLTVDFCNAQKTVFGDNDVFTSHGDMAGMGDGMVDGMVLALSLWGDNYSHMLWLDSNYPTDADPSVPGIARGTCPTDSGDPDDLEANHPNAQVTYSNIRFGPLGSTFAQGNTGGSSSSIGTTTTSART